MLKEKMAEQGTTGRVLVVDDEPTIIHVLREFLEEKGCQVQTAGTAEEGMCLLEESPPDIALVDVVLPGMSGLDLLERIKEVSPNTEVLIMTSHTSLESVLRAIRQGAYDYLQKPFDDLEEMWLRVQRALEKHGLTLRNRSLLVQQERQNHELMAAITRLTSLIDTGRAMAEFDSLSDLQNFLMGVVASQLEVNCASLMLIDEDGEMRIVAQRGMSGVEVEKIRVRVGQGIAGRVAETGKAFLVTDNSNDPRVEKPRDPNSYSSTGTAPISLCVPIKSSKKVLGVINATSRLSGARFTWDDLAFVEALAAQVAISIRERTRHMKALQ